MSSCSFILMPSTEVRRLAEECIRHVEECRKAEVEAEIVMLSKSYAKSWWRRLFGLPVPPHDELEEEVRERDPFGFQQGWGAVEVAKKLLKAVERADLVHVSVADLDWLA